MKRSILVTLISIWLPTTVTATTLYQQVEPVPTSAYLETYGVLEPERTRGTIRLGFEGMYVQPGNNTFTYAQRGITESTLFAYDPKYTFNFRILGTYEVNDEYDVSINWLRLRSTTVNGVSSNSFNLFLPNNPTTGDPFGSFKNISSALTTTLDSINVEAARIWRAPDLPESLVIRTLIGIQYAMFKANMTSLGSNSIFGSNQGYLNTQSRYEGIGPRVGTEVFYEVVNGLEIIGSVAGNVLFGNLKWDQQSLAPRGGSTIQTSENRQSQTIFGVETKAGLSYTFNVLRASWSIEGGYQWANYFNMVRNTQFDTEDFTYQGPYFAIRLAV